MTIETYNKPLQRKLQSSLSFIDELPVGKAVLLLSGGIDSCVLLDLLKRFRPSFYFECLHVNYQLRGEESMLDERLVVQKCLDYSIPLEVKRVTLEGKAAIQSRARNIRYQLARELAQINNWKYALTAHQADDQLETVLMNMERGCGLRGLQGIRRSSFNGELQVFRPLLEMFREDIQEYAQIHGVTFRNDSSNAQNFYKRNQIRNLVLPDFKKKHGRTGVNYFLKKSLEIQKLVSGYEQQSLDVFRKANRGSYHYFDKEYFYGLHSECQFMLIEKLLINYGYREELGSSLYEEIQQLIAGQKICQKKFGRALLFVDHKGVYAIKDHTFIKDQVVCQINGVGQYKLDCLPLSISLIKTPREDWAGPKPGVLSFDFDKIKWPLDLRHYKAGEKIALYGRKGRKKISDFLNEKKIPRILRPFYPVICDQNNLLGVLGLDISHDYQVDSDTKNVCDCFSLAP